MGLDTSRIPNERARRATENYERMNNEFKDFRRTLERFEKGLRTIAQIVVDGTGPKVRKRVEMALDELDLLPFEEPVFDEETDANDPEDSESAEDEDSVVESNEGMLDSDEGGL